MDIPFELQQNNTVNRMCGAAALSMVYNYYGMKQSQLDVWDRISSPDSYGKYFAKTFNVCHDVLRQGLFGLILKAINPIKTLKVCKINSITAILVHRLNLNSQLGHFTVFLDIKGNDVFYHDPMNGPYRRKNKRKMLRLWEPAPNEVTGNILLPISNVPYKTTCSTCGLIIPLSTECPYCKKEINLQPSIALGCIDRNCAERLWESIICPYCDGTIDLI